MCAPWPQGASSNSGARQRALFLKTYFCCGGESVSVGGPFGAPTTSSNRCQRRIEQDDMPRSVRLLLLAESALPLAGIQDPSLSVVGQRDLAEDRARIGPGELLRPRRVRHLGDLRDLRPRLLLAAPELELEVLRRLLFPVEEELKYPPPSWYA